METWQKTSLHFNFANGEIGGWYQMKGCQHMTLCQPVRWWLLDWIRSGIQHDDYVHQCTMYLKHTQQVLIWKISLQEKNNFNHCLPHQLPHIRESKCIVLHMYVIKTKFLLANCIIALLPRNVQPTVSGNKPIHYPSRNDTFFKRPKSFAQYLQTLGLMNC